MPLKVPRDFLPALSVTPGLNSHWEYHGRGEQCLYPLGRANWKEPPVCHGWRPVSRRRGSWRLRDTPGISRCLNTLFGPGFGVEGWPWRPDTVSRLSCLALGFRLPSTFFQYHCDTNRVPNLFLFSAFVYIPEGGG